MTFHSCNSSNLSKVSGHFVNVMLPYDPLSGLAFHLPFNYHFMTFGVIKCHNSSIRANRIFFSNNNNSSSVISPKVRLRSVEVLVLKLSFLIVLNAFHFSLYTSFINFFLNFLELKKGFVIKMKLNEVYVILNILCM